MFIQALFSIILLGGTGILLLGRCLAEANGLLLPVLAFVALFFSFALYSQVKSLRA